MGNTKPLIEVENLKVHFPLKRSLRQVVAQESKKYVKAVNGVSFQIHEGKTMALVGESGCGKTTLGRAIVRLNDPISGLVLFDGKEISSKDAWETNHYRKEIQYIFQNPYASLNPKFTILKTVRRPLDIFNLYSPRDRDDRVVELLRMTGISSRMVHRYPHEFSGGQRQRICIARALAAEPRLIIADEPTSALDVSVQCQILDLLRHLQEKLNLTMLFISHDLGVVNYISDKVLIMYLGQIVEEGDTYGVFTNPKHPYSKALLEALPRRGSVRHESRVKLHGYIPSPIDPPSGCLLHERCPFAQELCALEVPVIRSIDDDRNVACHFPLEGF